MSKTSRDKDKKIAAFYSKMTIEEAKQLGMVVRSKSIYNASTGYRFMFTNAKRYHTCTQRSVREELEHFILDRGADMYIPSGLKELHNAMLKKIPYAKAFASFDESIVCDKIILDRQYEALFPGEWKAYVELLLIKYLDTAVCNLLRKKNSSISVSVNDYDDQLMSPSDIKFFAVAEEATITSTNLQETLSIYKKICERSFKIALGLLKTSREDLLSSLMLDQLHAEEDYAEDYIDFTKHIAAVIEPKYLTLLLVDNNPSTRAFAKMYLDSIRK